LIYLARAGGGEALVLAPGSRWRCCCSAGFPVLAMVGVIVNALGAAWWL
jgi:hypothetical protein